MTESGEAPCLRHVEAFAARVDGREVICLRDPLGLTEAILTVPRPVAEILTLLDGTRSLVDVQAEIMRRHGTLVLRDELEKLVEALDHHLFLEGPRLAEERQRLAEAFRASPMRAAFHAGKAYAAEPEALARDLEALLAHRDGPGSVEPRHARLLHGLIAPHIDFARGGPAYAWAYKAVAEAPEADCFIVFGTAHGGLDGQAFAATAKPYATPFGPVAVDDEVLHAIVRRAPADLFAAELAHRSEHSIEFQAVCLRYLHPRGAEVRIVPLLTSFAQECLVGGRDPALERTVTGVLDAVRGTMAAVSRRYCVVAGADLAHVGPRFGDPVPVSSTELGRIASEDRALLEPVTRGDAAGFFATVARERDRRRICGLSPIYALLRTLPPSSGRLLRYGQWPDPEGTVTFASVAFEEPNP